MTIRGLGFFWGCLALPLIIIRCSDSEKSTPLAAGLQSNTSFETVRKTLQLDSEKWVIVEDSKSSSDKSKPFNILTVEVPFSDLNVPGTLRLSFFNDRLVETWFFPINMADYQDGLRLKKNIDVTSSNEINMKPHTIVRKGIDYKKRPYIAWEDSALIKEKERWLWKHS